MEIERTRTRPQCGFEKVSAQLISSKYQRSFEKEQLDQVVKDY